MELPKSLALCLVCNKDLGPLNQIPTFYHRPNVLFSRTPATSTLLRHKLESIVKDIVVFRSETCCLCVKCAGLINLADALEAELQSVCRQLSDHYWRTARLRGFGEERAIVCITPVPPPPTSAAAATAGGGARRPAQPGAAPPGAPPPPPPPPPPVAVAPPGVGPGPMVRLPGPPGAVWAPGPGPGPGPAGWRPGVVPVVGPRADQGRALARSVSQESDDANGVCQLLSAVEVELTEVKQEPGDEPDANNHLMREPVDIEVDPWKDLGYEDANAMEKLASQKTRSMPPPSQSAPVRWPVLPLPPGGSTVCPAPGGWPTGPPSAARQTAVARPTRTYSSAGPRPESQPAAARPVTTERPPVNLPPGAQRTHQRIMKTLTSHSSAIQQAVANGVLSLEVRPPGSAAPPSAGAAKKVADRPSRPAAPSRSLPAIAPAPPKSAATATTSATSTAASTAGAASRASPAASAQMSALSPATNFKIKLPSLTPRDGASSPTSVTPAAVPPRPATPTNIDAPPAQEADSQLDAFGEDSSPPQGEPPSRTVAWFHKSQRLRPGNYTYVKSGDSLNGKLIPFVAPKGRPRRERAESGPIVRLVVGTPMNRRRYPPLEKALAVVAAAARGLGPGRQSARPGQGRRVVVAQERSGAGAPAAQPGDQPASTSTEKSQKEETDGKEEACREEVIHEEDGATKEVKLPVTPVKRGPGRPRKDGLPPGSGKPSATKQKQRGRPAGQSVKRPASNSQPSTPVAKRQRLERPPESLEGRRHSRRLSARLSHPEPETEPEPGPEPELKEEPEPAKEPNQEPNREPEPEPAKEPKPEQAGGAAVTGSEEGAAEAAAEEKPSSPPTQSDSSAKTGDGETSLDAETSNGDDKVISGDTKAPFDADEVVTSDTEAASGQNGETGSSAGGGGETDGSAAPPTDSGKAPAAIDGQSDPGDAAPSGTEAEHIPTPAAAP